MTRRTKLPIKVIEHQDPFTSEWIEQQANGAERVLACDFYILGAEAAKRVTGGYSFGLVVNIDHHAPTSAMRRRISSTNLALERLSKCGEEPDDSVVIISHTDCDSVLSSGIVSGELPPDLRLGLAAIAADHTGEANVIADMLQELDNIRSVNLRADPQFALEESDSSYLRYSHDLVRRYLERGEDALDERAQNAIAQRQRKRSAAQEAVARGDFTMLGGIALATLPEKLDGELFPALLPDAQVILMSTRRDGLSRWESKIWLGLAAPEGSSLHDLNIREFDSAFGGRWNAGSNRRNGGTSIAPKEYAELLRLRLGSFDVKPAIPDQVPRDCI